MTEQQLPPSATDGLLPRVRVIEEQPLASRAAAYAALHAELSSRLERSDLAATEAS